MHQPAILSSRQAHECITTTAFVRAVIFFFASSRSKHAVRIDVHNRHVAEEPHRQASKNVYDGTMISHAGRSAQVHRVSAGHSAFVRRLRVPSIPQTPLVPVERAFVDRL